MLKLDVRFADTRGNGVGRWRMYFEGEDLAEVAWAGRHLVPKCQVRVRDGREVVYGPCRAEKLAALRRY